MCLWACAESCGCANKIVAEGREAGWARQSRGEGP